jgi:Na+/alanine symporter
MLVLLIAVGLFLSIKLRGFQFVRFGYISKNTVGSLFKKNLHLKESGSVSPFQALTTALALCFNALMALPNLIALTILSKLVVDATKKHFEKKNVAKDEKQNS